MPVLAEEFLRGGDEDGQGKVEERGVVPEGDLGDARLLRADGREAGEGEDAALFRLDDLPRSPANRRCSSRWRTSPTEIPTVRYAVAAESSR